MKLVNTAIIRVTLVLLAGTFTGFYISLPLSWSFFLLAGLLLVFILTFLRADKLLLQDPIFGGSCLFLFFSLGILNVQLHQPRNQALHYTNLISLQEHQLLVSIAEVLKPDLYRERYLAEVLRIDTSRVHGKILLLLPSGEKGVKAGDQFLISSQLDSIPKSWNPQQFNYRKFMGNRGIFFLMEPSAIEIQPVPQTPDQGLRDLREEIIKKLRKQDFGKEELAVIQALLLGQRRDLSQETNDNFAAAGVMHILAVSGLHVGIILLLLNGLFSFMDTWQWGKIIKTILLLLLLWSYALLAGSSPSIVRAVCMFSFVAIGMQLKRRTSVLNSLFLSLLFLLLLHPNWALEVGFQLSYLAVFSIVILQPPLFTLYVPKNNILKYFWSLFTVTLAAQAGVMPLSLYYFHQFPGLFFLSNLVILPFLGIILGMGIVIILLTLLDLLPAVLAQGFNMLIKLLNNFVEWVAMQEKFLFQDIPFSLLQLFAFYGLLFTFFLLMKGFSIKRLSLLLGSAIWLQGTFICASFQKSKPELVVFHKSRYTVLGHKQKRHLELFHNLKDPVRDHRFIKNYSLKSDISTLHSDALKNFYFWEDELLMLIDSSSIYKVPGVQPERILLTGSPKVNLDRLLLHLQPKIVIADGSNYRSYVNRWKETCRKRKIPFHYTGEKGSYEWRKRPQND